MKIINNMKASKLYESGYSSTITNTSVSYGSVGYRENSSRGDALSSITKNNTICSSSFTHVKEKNKK